LSSSPTNPSIRPRILIEHFSTDFREPRQML